MNQARILLLGGNYLPEPTGIGKYNGEMMHWLAGEGFECGVVTSYPYYPHWKIQSPYERKSYWYSKETVATEDKDIKVYRCPHYIPQKPSGLKRMISDLSFFIAAFFQVFMLLFTKKYDYVIAVVPPFQLGLLGMFYRFFKGGKLVYHIQDLQIDAAKELQMIKSNSLLNVMFSIEKLILKKSDFVSTISDGMMSRVMKKVNKPVIFFPNWCDTTSFHPLTNKEELKSKFDLDPAKKVVLYSGAIGEKQGLEAVIHAAKALVDQNIQFVICGSGPYKEKLIKLVEKLGVTNLAFMPLQPKETFNDFLN
ncbi:MAG: colanic acid biosynthesis glycosyltransferase WcaI, partial [Pedobacter sp.]